MLSTISLVSTRTARRAEEVTGNETFHALREVSGRFGTEIAGINRHSLSAKCLSHLDLPGLGFWCHIGDCELNEVGPGLRWRKSASKSPDGPPLNWWCES
jgi:hypothetical protein